MIDNMINIWYDPYMDELIEEEYGKTYTRIYSDIGGIEDELTGNTYYEIYSQLVNKKVLIFLGEL